MTTTYWTIMFYQLGDWGCVWGAWGFLEEHDPGVLQAEGTHAPLPITMYKTPIVRWKNRRCIMGYCDKRIRELSQNVFQRFYRDAWTEGLTAGQLYTSYSAKLKQRIINDRSTLKSWQLKPDPCMTCVTATKVNDNNRVIPLYHWNIFLWFYKNSCENHLPIIFCC